MLTTYNEDQQAVAEAFAAFFANESATPVVRAAAATGVGFDPGLWSKLATTGAPGMAVSESLGGGGATLVDMAVVVSEWGKRIAPVPLVEHAVATRALAAVAGRRSSDNAAKHSPGSRTSPGEDTPAVGDAGNHTQDQGDVGVGDLEDLVGRLAAGDLVATIVLAPLDGSRHAPLTPAGAVADVVVAHDGAELMLSVAAPPGVARPNTGDLPLADRDLSDAQAVADGDGGKAVFEAALTEWRALMAVAYGAMAQEVLDMAVAYVKERHQFGVPVGSFQAVQHGLADAATRVQGARLLAWRAVCAVQAGDDGAARLAAMALLFAAESARFAADRALQYHGGYGYSEEYDVQLYYRRAAAWILQLGDPGLEYARLADSDLGRRQTATTAQAPSPE